MEPERKGQRQKPRLTAIPAPGSRRILSTPSVDPPSNDATERYNADGTDSNLTSLMRKEARVASPCIALKGLHGQLTDCWSGSQITRNSGLIIPKFQTLNRCSLSRHIGLNLT